MTIAVSGTICTIMIAYRNDAATGEPEPGDRQRGQERDHDRDDDGRDGHDRAVAQRGPEHRIVDDRRGSWSGSGASARTRA